MNTSRQAIGVIGGSGLYAIEGLTNVREEVVSTPFGPPSAPIVCGEFHGHPILFLARHGRGHRILPGEVNNRANIYALKILGAQWCIGVSSVGSLREELPPGTVVIPDQVIDRTHGRESTFFGDGIVAHVSMADPFCPELRRALREAGSGIGRSREVTIHDGGTVVVMQGPQFSTRAEAHLHRAWGASLIGMTTMPEAKLAREAEIAYATLALVTDYDCWHEDEAAVDMAMVYETMQRNVGHARALIAAVLPLLAGREPSAIAAHALRNAFATKLADVPAARLEQLGAILAPYRQNN